MIYTITYTIRLYCVKTYSLLSDLFFLKFIHHYQKLILIPRLYNSFVVVVFVVYIYIFLKAFGGDIFYMHKEQNLILLLIDICMIFFLLVFLKPFFIIKICSYTGFICFFFFFLCIYHRK